MLQEGGIIADVVVSLLKQLDEKKEVALKSQKDGTIEQECHTIKDMLEVVEKYLKRIKGIILRGEIWEGELMHVFGAVAQLADKMVESVDKGVVTEFQQKTISSELKQIDDQLVTIEHNIGSHIVLSMTTESGMDTSSSSSQPSTSVYVKISDELQQLGLEELYQESSAVPYIKEMIDTLDPDVRRCLFCVSVFPEKSIIKKRLLIYWWIGAGLVNPTGNKTAEENGEICFGELAARGLVQPIKRNHSAVADRCTMRPGIRKMVMAAAMKGLFFFDSRGDPAPSSGEEGSFEIVRNLSNQDQTLTLFNINKRCLKVDGIPDDTAVMHLGRWQSDERHHIEVEDSELLKGLMSSNKLNKLRYLSLQGISRITELPGSIGKLTNMVILDLRACHNLEELPESIVSLKKLTHLDVSKCYLLDHMPRGLGSLSELQVMKGFVIANSRSKHQCRLTDLATFKKLRKLSISIGRESLVAEGEFSRLSEFKSLRSLTITWGLDRLVRSNSEITLSPPKGLEKLDIRCFPRAEAPAWLTPDKLGSLKKLYIRGGKLATLDDKSTWKVEVLRFIFLKDFLVDKEKLRKMFPNLTHLEERQQVKPAPT